jgi:ATP adenylyltransferase
MDTLWAPWRMEYILSAKQDGCFMCDLIAADQDRENLILRRGEHALILLNRYPYNNAHLMVAPYRHVADLADLTDAESLEVMQLTQFALRQLRATVAPHGFNVGVNLGKAAGAGLEEHVHLHVVPRWNGDTNFMPLLAETRVMPQALLKLYDQLLPAFAPTPPSA